MGEYARGAVVEGPGAATLLAGFWRTGSAAFAGFAAFGVGVGAAAGAAFFAVATSSLTRRTHCFLVRPCKSSTAGGKWATKPG